MKLVYHSIMFFKYIISFYLWNDCIISYILIYSLSFERENDILCLQS